MSRACGTRAGAADGRAVKLETRIVRWLVRKFHRFTAAGAEMAAFAALNAARVLDVLASIVRWLASCMACLMGLGPAVAIALELGPIEARSTLYEPLDARIPVRDARSGDFEGLNVTLGSPAQFELAGVARLQHLGLLEFVVVAEGESDGYIHVRTDEPIIEPSLTFLVEVDWPRGRTVRGYKLRLVSAAGSATAGSTRRAEPAAVTETGPPPAESDSTPTSSESGYGPVRKSETLWSIASRLRPDTSVSTHRMMLAILEANPEAFAIMNVNALRAGATLRIPSRDEIGSDEVRAAVAEVQRQHSAWLEHRKSASARAAPAAADSEVEPGGRIEVVSPETAADAIGQEDGGEVSTLLRELALAMEETDAARRENDELKLRLADVEGRIGELNRLIELKDEEIAALQAELSAPPESMPAQDPVPGEAEATVVAATQMRELNRLVELKDEEIAALRSELRELSETTTAPGAGPIEAEPTPPPAPAADETAPAGAESSPLPVPAVTGPAATAQAEPKSLPFGLGTLPVNPVFLVGGAGLLLLLLGVLALLRRRRSSAGVEEDVIEVAEASPAEEEDLLLELEAVAAELSDDRRDPPAHPPRVGSIDEADEGAVSEARADPVPGRAYDGLAEERIAALWRDDDDDRAPERERSARSDPGEDTFDIDALTADDSVPGQGEDQLSDQLDLAELAAELEAEPAEEEPSRTADEARGSLDRTIDGRDGGTAEFGALRSTPPAAIADMSGRDPESPDEGRPGSLLAALDDLRSEDVVPEAPEPAPAAGVGDATARGFESPGDERDDALLALLDDRGAATAESGASGTTDEVDAADGRSPGTAAEGSVDRGPEANDSDVSAPWEKKAPLDDAIGRDTEAIPLEEVGEDEVQTKIDLAQVYMEMGDAESARGFLEAVLAEGDAEQRDTAREMLSKLT